MPDKDCVAFLQWALPQLHLRWAGFRKVRRQVCRRLNARMESLGLSDLSEYRALLLAQETEWEMLDALCRVTISRFCRDRGLWSAMRSEWLADLAQRTLTAGRRTLRVWSIGCASGEEAYTVSLCWWLELSPHFPHLTLEVVGTDVDAHLLRRARAAHYPSGCLREVPEEWRSTAFEPGDGGWVLQPRFRRGVVFRRMDLRKRLPSGTFDLILCRNLAFTYFDTGLQTVVASKLVSRLHSGGILVLGRHERLPVNIPTLVAERTPQTDVWRRITDREEIA